MSWTVLTLFWALEHFSAYTLSEPLNDDGSFVADVFFNTLGSEYISIALQAARGADPNAKLFINDFNIEGTGETFALNVY